MKIVKRVQIGVMRKKVQSLVLACVILLMSTLTIGSILVQQAVTNTDLALRASLPSIAILVGDDERFLDEFEETGIWPYRSRLTMDILRELGALPYVRTSTFTALGHNLYSSELERVWYPDLFLELAEPILDPIDIGAFFRDPTFPLQRFFLGGTGNLNIWEVEAEIIEIVDG